jgi:hypothetical protein
MDLAKRDIIINDLNNVIKQKKSFLREKKDSLRTKSKDNTYLNGVVDEYNKYFNSESNKRDEQTKALQVLFDYITTIILDPTSTEEIIKQCKYDHSMIVKEMNK